MTLCVCVHISANIMSMTNISQYHRLILDFKFSKNRIMQYIVFWVWLHLLNIIFIRIIHVIPCCRRLFTLIARVLHFVTASWVGYPVDCWQTFGLFPGSLWTVLQWIFLCMSFYASPLGSKDLKTTENLNPNSCDSKAYILATTLHHLPPSSAYHPSLERTNITTFPENALSSARLQHVSEHFAGC